MYSHSETNDSNNRAFVSWGSSLLQGRKPGVEKLARAIDIPGESFRRYKVCVAIHSTRFQSRDRSTSSHQSIIVSCETHFCGFTDDEDTQQYAPIAGRPRGHLLSFYFKLAVQSNVQFEKINLHMASYTPLASLCLSKTRCEDSLSQQRDSIIGKLQKRLADPDLRAADGTIPIVLTLLATDVCRPAKGSSHWQYRYFERRNEDYTEVHGEGLRTMIRLRRRHPTKYQAGRHCYRYPDFRGAR
jgi:hypothetical protein